MALRWSGCKKCKPNLSPSGCQMHFPQDAKCTFLLQNILSDVGGYSPTSVASHALLCLLFHILTHTLASHKLCDSTKMQMWQQIPAKNQLCINFRSPSTLSEEPFSSLILLGAFLSDILHISKPCLLLHISKHHIMSCKTHYVLKKTTQNAGD